ncbi:MAG: hypothetical protein V4808_00930 [Pseudomonadota bacterium]
MPEPHGRRMKMAFHPVICVCLAAMMLPATGFAQPPRDHKQDSQGRRNQPPGVSVREIERRVTPKFPGAQYLGFDYDPSRNIYTLKFMRDGKVTWVDVSGSTGNIVSIDGKPVR